MKRPSLFVVLGLTVTLVGAWLLIFALPRWYGGEKPTVATTTAAPNQPAPGERKITATLFYVSQDGMRLVGVPREVPFGATPADQARRIVESALAPAPAPYASAVPGGTKLRALFLSPRGDAYVDLSKEISAGHTGGSIDELFTVYSLVNALTVNLPAVSAVQILVEGKEVDTLAGHVDLRRPLGRNLKWTELASR